MSGNLPRTLVALLSLAHLAATAAGIRVRFLASPPEDSVVRYDVWRCDSSAAPVKVGFLAAAALDDTLSYPDATARKGVAYLYCLRAVNAGGLESDPSDSTRLALPRLDLPDTARPSGGRTSLSLAPAAHPLEGHAALAFSLADSSRLRIVHDTASRSLVFLSPRGVPDTVTAVIRAAYHGKFSDQDTVVAILAGEGAVSLVRARAGAAPEGPRLRRAEGGAVLISVPTAGITRHHRPDGRLAH